MRLVSARLVGTTVMLSKVPHEASPLCNLVVLVPLCLHWRASPACCRVTAQCMDTLPLVQAAVCFPFPPAGALPSLSASSSPICILENTLRICCRPSLCVDTAMALRSSAMARMFCSRGVKPSSSGSHHRRQLSSSKSSAIRVRTVIGEMYLQCG